MISNKDKNVCEYMKAIEEILTKHYKCSETERNRLIKEYEEDFAAFFEDGYKENVVACGMITHLL
jgi:hypothetical protein